MIYFPTVMVRYSLVVLKVPLNPNKQTKQNYSMCVHNVMIIPFLVCEVERGAVQHIGDVGRLCELNV